MRIRVHREKVDAAGPRNEMQCFARVIISARRFSNVNDENSDGNFFGNVVFRYGNGFSLSNLLHKNNNLRIMRRIF